MGWSGHVPPACHNTIVPVPLNYAPLLWGWPHRFTRRLAAHGGSVILVGPYGGSGLTTGIDDPETFAKVPARFDGHVWTNRIEILGPLITQQNP